MADTRSDNRRIVNNTIYMTAQMVFGLFVSLYTSRVILQTLGVEDFGIYNVVAGFVSMFTFLNGALTTGTQRFYNYELGNNGIIGAKNVFNTAIRIQIILAIIVLFAVETVGVWYINFKMVIPPERLVAAKWVFQLSVISMCVIIIGVPYGAAIMAHEKMGFYSLVNAIDVILKLGIVLVLPLLGGDKLIIYGILLLFITLFNFFINLIYTSKRFEEIRICKNPPKGLMKDMLSFSFWNAFGAFGSMAEGQGINMVLNLFFGPVVNAARGIAYQVNGALQGLVSNVSVAIKPQLTQSYARGDLQRTYTLMFSMSKISTLILYAFALPLIIEVTYVLRLWLGDVVPQYTSIFLCLVVIISFVSNLHGPISYVVHATGKMKKYQITCSLIQLSSILFAYFALVLGMGPSSVFYVILIVSIFKLFVSLFLLRSITTFSIRKYLRAVFIPLLLFELVSFAIPLIPHYLMAESLFRLIVVIVVSECVIFPAAYYILLNSSEKLMVIQYIGKVTKKYKH